MIEIQVPRGAIGEGQAVTREVALAHGEALLEIELFSMTANNVTYAVHGVDFQYWNFWPAPEGLGVVPVWGFARVIECRVDGIEAGQRFYGYWPMASHAVVRPGKVSARGFDDVSEHRAKLAVVYNRYVPADPAMGSEAVQALFRPLFTTAFALEAMLLDGPKTLVLASASSKTALGLAALAHARGARVIGLTSAANAEFCEATGYFDLVLNYDETAALAKEAGPVALVDMAGNGVVRAAVHRALGDRLVASHVVGDTHWDVLAADLLPGPQPQFFFAPTVIAQRVLEWGPAGFEVRLAAAWALFSGTLGWLQVCEVTGAEAVLPAWAALVSGKIDPRQGIVARL
jgi:NADPH:quinone reductase-like Zn-dependent oxidoreductase